MQPQFKRAIEGAAKLLKPLLPPVLTVSTSPACTRLIVTHTDGTTFKAHPTLKQYATPEHLARTMLRCLGLDESAIPDE